MPPWPPPTATSWPRMHGEVLTPRKPSTAPVTMVARHPAGRRKPYGSLIREACSYLELVGRERQTRPVAGVDHFVPGSLSRDEQPRRRVPSTAPFDDTSIVEPNFVETMRLEQSLQRTSSEMPDVIVPPAESKRPAYDREDLGV